MDEKEEREMNNDEYRALVEAGPAVVMVAKEDMLKLLDRLKAAEKNAKVIHLALDYGKGDEKRESYERYPDMETGMERRHASEMAGKLGDFAREREAGLIRAFWWSIAVLVLIISLPAVFE
jgi:hypothetical protein